MQTFEFEGNVYKVNPGITEFLLDAGLDNDFVTRVNLIFEKEQITRILHLQTITLPELEMLLNNKKIAHKIFAHLELIRHRGRIIKTSDEIQEIEKQYEYLQTPTTSLDLMMSYANGEMGLRTQSIVELYGTAGVGKTQWCLSQALLAIKSWNCAVGIIDTEGSFTYSRFAFLAKYWQVDIENKIFMARAHNFDDLEFALEEFEKIIEKNKIKLIIIDSIIAPLKTQYPISGDDIALLQPRQRHLKTVTDKMKLIAQMHNIVILYTNQIRSDMEGGTVPQGGNILNHASDVRISLAPMELVDELTSIGIKRCQATIVDCAFLPNLSGEYLIGPMGIADVMQVKKVKEHTEKIIQGIAVDIDGVI
ncbi:MAG: hypothetical protein INQ03_09165 [Candidatus Heimdallarchaeota archaeon]|nr:hypothetical protein [Candidatus Heimdallarchaeota archaeon]